MGYITSSTLTIYKNSPSIEIVGTYRPHAPRTSISEPLCYISTLRTCVLAFFYISGWLVNEHERGFYITSHGGYGHLPRLGMWCARVEEMGYGEWGSTEEIGGGGLGKVKNICKESLRL